MILLIYFLNIYIYLYIYIYINKYIYIYQEMKNLKLKSLKRLSVRQSDSQSEWAKHCENEFLKEEDHSE